MMRAGMLCNHSTRSFLNESLWLYNNTALNGVKVFALGCPGSFVVYVILAVVRTLDFIEFMITLLHFVLVFRFRLCR